MSFGLPWWLGQYRFHLQCRRTGLDPWVGKIPWRSDWYLTPVFLPGDFLGQRSLVGYSPQGHKELDTTGWLTHTHTHTHTHPMSLPCSWYWKQRLQEYHLCSKQQKRWWGSGWGHSLHTCLTDQSEAEGTQGGGSRPAQPSPAQLGWSGECVLDETPPSPSLGVTRWGPS